MTAGHATSYFMISHGFINTLYNSDVLLRFHISISSHLYNGTHEFKLSNVIECRCDSCPHSRDRQRLASLLLATPGHSQHQSLESIDDLLGDAHLLSGKRAVFAYMPLELLMHQASP